MNNFTDLIPLPTEKRFRARPNPPEDGPDTFVRDTKLFGGGQEERLRGLLKYTSDNLCGVEKTGRRLGVL